MIPPGEDDDQGDFTPPSPEELSALLPDYQFEELIAQGGMGAVYRGVQIKLDRPIAIKVLPRHFGADLGYAQRFELEAKAMARLTHNNIVAVFDYGESDDGHFLYFIMEFVEGTDLHEMIQGGPLSEDDAIAILRQACGALQYAHEHGIVHRDIKPANLLVDQAGQVKVADFGLAKVTAGEVDDTVFGTPEYVAPEALIEGVEIDHRADIYSLGVLIYELLIGQPPRGEFELPSVLRTDVDRRIDDIILKTITPNPDDRFDRASEVDHALQAIQSSPKLVRTAAAPARPALATGKVPTLATGRVPTLATGSVSTKTLPKKKSPAGTIITLLLLAVLAAGAGIYFLNKKNADDLTDGRQNGEKSHTPPPHTDPLPDANASPIGTASVATVPDMSEPEEATMDSPETVIEAPPAYTEPPVVDPAWNALRSQGGRLRAYGVNGAGAPISVERGAAFDDLVNVYARSGGAWLALRPNGNLVSHKPNEQNLTGIRSIHAAGTWAQFVKDDGTVWNDRFKQRAPDDLSDVIKAVNGNQHGAALNGDGSVFVYGARHGGQDIVSLPPLPLTDIVDIAASAECVAALDSHGNVHTWGRDFELNSLEGADIVEINAGLRHFIARTRLGEVIEWQNADPTRTRPVPNDLGQVIAVRAGGGVSAAQKPDGSWVAWGNNGYGITDLINELGPAIDIDFFSITDKRGFLLWIEPREGAQPIDSSRVGHRLVALTGEFRDRYHREFLLVRNEEVDKLNQQLVGAFQRSLEAVRSGTEIAENISNEIQRIEALIARNDSPYATAPNLFPKQSPPPWMPDRMREYRETYREEYKKSQEAVAGVGPALYSEYLAALKSFEEEIIASGDEEEITRIREIVSTLEEKNQSILR